jgi:hypothetical protein
VKKILIALVVGLGLQAFAGVSLLTGAILIGGDKVYDLSLEWTLDRSIRKVASLIGEVCTLTEHFYYEGGLGYARASFVMDGLKREKWVVTHPLWPLFKRSPRGLVHGKGSGEGVGGSLRVQRWLRRCGELLQALAS